MRVSGPLSSSLSPFSSYNSKIQIMYSIRCERCRALARRRLSRSGERATGAREVSGAMDGEKGPLSSRRRGYKRKGPVGAPRTRGERSGKEMRKSVINWRWDYSRRALRRQAARRTTWKVLPDTFRAPPPRPLLSLSFLADYVAPYYPARWAPVYGLAVLRPCERADTKANRAKVWALLNSLSGSHRVTFRHLPNSPTDSPHPHLVLPMSRITSHNLLRKFQAMWGDSG